MDNAAKALMIAGEMLIALLVVGLIMSVVSKFGNFSSNMNDKMSKNKQEEFNNHFFAFEGRIDISAAEIAGIVNYAKECNEKSELFLKDGYSNIKNSPDFVDVQAITNEKTIAFFNVNVPTGKLSDKQYKDDLKEFFDKQYKDDLKEFLEKNNDKYFSCKAKIIEAKGTDAPYDVKRKIDDTGNFGDITLEDQNNGRKGYVKLIQFKYTYSEELKKRPHNLPYLTIRNRNDFIINN